MEVRAPVKCQGLQLRALMRVLLLCWLCCRPLVRDRPRRRWRYVGCVVCRSRMVGLTRDYNA